MFFVILAFACGVLFLQTCSELPPFWLGLVVAGGLLFLGCCWSGGRRSWALVGAAFLLGVSWAGWRAEWRLRDALDAEWEGRDVVVQGVVGGLPQQIASGVRFELRVENVLTPGAELPRRVLLNWYAPRGNQGAKREKPAQLGPGAEQVEQAVPAVAPGQRWRLTVRLKKAHGSANPGGFDYEMWLFERGIRATGYVRPAGEEMLAGFVPSFESGVESLRAAARERFSRVLPAAEWPWMGILVALAVGDQKAVEGDLWTVFNRTGTTHLMSISGLHVTMVAGMLGGLLAFLWRWIPGLALRYPAQRAGILAAALGAFAYALLAGFGVPAQRTFYMLLAVALAVLSGCLPAARHILALALLLVLLIDPWAVLAAGFWLSFGAVAALLYIGGARVGDTGGWRSRVRTWGMVQWAATLATLPVLMVVFQQFSLVSPLANALAIPVISLIVTPLALLAAVVPWPPILMLAHAVLDGLMQFLIWCAAWPVWQAAMPPWWAAPLALIGVAVCLLPRGVPGRALGFVFILPCLYWPPERLPPGVAQIDVLDVGQGQAVLIRTQNHMLLYDAGPRYSAEADAGQRVLLPYLRWLGVEKLNRVLLSHGDTDHAGGFASVAAGVPVGDVWSSIVDQPGTLCAAGQRWQWDGVDFSILHPLPEDYAAGKKNNALSCVLRIEAGGRRLLLTGDIDAADEAALLAREKSRQAGVAQPGKTRLDENQRVPALAADAILAPHHGAAGSSSPAFVAAVGAREAIFSAGYRNRFQHPRPAVLQRYADHGARLWRTDTGGSIHVRLGGGKLEIHAWRERHARYWHGR